LLAFLNRCTDLGGVLRAEPSHLGDDLLRALLKVHDGIHELFHSFGANRRAISSANSRLLNLTSDLSQILQAFADAFLHGF
jgi:hypothetical protein